MEILKENENPITDKQEKLQTLVTYEAVNFNSFPAIAEDILLSKEDKNTFCFLDYDQTITGGEIKNIWEPQISEDVKNSFNKLLANFPHGMLCITTNRGYGSNFLENFFLRTNRALSKMVNFLEESDYPGTVPIFLGLVKQIPGLKINGRGALIDHIVNYVVNNNLEGDISIFMAENFSILGLDRSVFPKEIAREVVKKLKKEHGRNISAHIRDYVLKH